MLQVVLGGGRSKFVKPASGDEDLTKVEFEYKYITGVLSHISYRVLFNYRIVV